MTAMHVDDWQRQRRVCGMLTFEEKLDRLAR